MCHTRRVTRRSGGLLAACTFAALIVVPSGVAGTSSNPSAITIADSASPPTDASTYPSQITVSGEPNVTDVNVTLNALPHTFADDADMLLVGPQGQSVILMSDAGGDVTSNATLTFDDQAA